MRLDEQAVLALCRLRDPHGVLSIFVDASPERQSSAHPAWTVEIKNQLAALRVRVKDEGPRERWTALDRRLGALSEDLEVLADPRAPGRGRALFATVDGSDVHTISVQVPLPDRVVLSDAAYVRPLVAALDEGRPTGIVCVERALVRLLETRLGETEELAHFTFEAATGDWREYKGPGPDNPAMTRPGASQRDRFERRLDEAVERFHRSVAERVSGTLRARGWDRVVLLQGPELTRVEELLRSNGDAELIAMEGIAGTARPRELAERVAGVVRDAQRRREAGLVTLAKDRAPSGGAGATGAPDILTALQEGRVAHLLVASDREFAGHRAPDGRLYADGQGTDVEAEDLVPEPNLAERMVERALDTGAKVTPVEDEAARALDDAGGVAAILRW